jgi:hypothetical protein
MPQRKSEIREFELAQIRNASVAIGSLCQERKSEMVVETSSPRSDGFCLQHPNLSATTTPFHEPTRTQEFKRTNDHISTL